MKSDCKKTPEDQEITRIFYGNTFIMFLPVLHQIAIVANGRKSYADHSLSAAVAARLDGG